MRPWTHGLFALVLIAGPPSAAHAADLDAMQPAEIQALQHRLAEGGCYQGAVDGRPSAATADAVKACPDQDPTLRIETGMHTAQIKRIGVDAACTVAVTGSDDKTARLWSMPDGRLLRTERLPVGTGDFGKVYAVAMSPDGSLAAAGGWDAADAHALRHAAYVFDVATGDNLRRIGTFDDVINHMAFSSDGRRLAVGLGSGGIRVLDVASGSELMYDKDYKDAAYGVAFGRDGSLYAVADDGFIRRYGPDLRRTAKILPKAGKDPESVAVDPSGERLAVGFYGKSVVEIYATATMRRIAAAQTGDIKGDDLSTVGWSRDGRRLYAAGTYQVKIDGSWHDMVRSFTRDGRHDRPDVPVAHNLVADMAPCGDGMLMGTADPFIVGLPSDGPATTLAGGHTADFRDAGANRLTASRDATKVRFGLVQHGVNPVEFDLMVGSLADAPDPMPNAVAPVTTGLDVTDWQDNVTPLFNGQKIVMKDFERSRSLAIRLATDGFVLGTEWSLRSFDAQGNQRWNKPTPSVTWEVDLTRGGEVVVAAYGDGTIRWHRWSDGQELLALFVTKDTRGWVAWTPSGYYMASPGAEDMIGWHINRGWQQQADFFPASRFRDRFSRPDIVRLVLQTLDEGAAVKQANAAAKRRDDSKPLIEQLPPVITILSPSDGSSVAPGTVEIRYNTRSPSGGRVDRVEALVDGAKIATRGLMRVEPATAQSADGGTGTIVVPMPDHDAIISLVAYAGGQASDAVRVQLKGAAPAGRGVAAEDESLKPTLYALLIGVANYQNKAFNLEYSDKDAAGLAEALKGQKGKLYKDVEVKVLTDQDATATAIKRGLSWLRKQTTAHDLAIVFAAGHGTTDARGKFWFLPYDTDPDDVAATAVSRDDISDVLFDLPGKKLLFLDACHSGAALNSGARGGTDIGTAVNDFAQAEGGVVAYAAATGREFSFERPDWGHGAFTKALIEGLEGKADLLHKGTITTATLDLFIENRVKELTGGQQHPVMSRPKTVPDFPIAVVQ